MVQHIPDGYYAWEGHPTRSELPLRWDGDEDVAAARERSNPIPPPPPMSTVITQDERRKRSRIVRSFLKRLINEPAGRTEVTPIPLDEPFSVLVYAKEHGFGCDEIVTRAVQHSVDGDDHSFGAMTLGRLFMFLERWREENRHEQVGLSIVSPNQIRDYLVATAMMTRSFEICDVFFEHGLDARRVWMFEDQIVDVSYWVTATGGKFGMSHLLNEKVRPLAGIDHVTCALETVRRRLADKSWRDGDRGGYPISYDSPGGPHWEIACWIFNEVWQAKLSPKNDPSIAPGTPLPGTGLLAYLAGDTLQRDNVLRHASMWACVKKDSLGEMLPTLDVDELCSKDHHLMHSFSTACGRPLETPLIEAVLNEWGDMVDMLLDMGADIDKKGHSSMTAYEVAQTNGLESMVKLLQEHKWARGWIARGLAFLWKSWIYCWSREPNGADGDE